MIHAINKYTIDDVLREYHKDPDSMVYIGCDSTSSKKTTTFITVVVIHKGAKTSEGGKGCKVFAFVQSEPKIKSINQKLLKETHIAMGYTLELMYGTENHAAIPIDAIEVHSDYNPNPRHKSHAVVQEARSYVMGQGLVHKIKPDAIAATGMADHIGRRLGDYKWEKDYSTLN